MLILNEGEVKGLMSMRECLALMRTAYSALGQGRAQNIPRGRIRFDDLDEKGTYYWLNCIPGAVRTLNACAVRLDSSVRTPIVAEQASGTYRNNGYVGLVLLFDIQTGDWVATLPDFTISGLRVAATSALVADVLARRDARSVGVFGSGKQARTHVEAICLVRPIERIRAFSPNREHLQHFCDEMTALVDRPVEPATPREVVDETDIVVCTTNAREPVFDGSWLADGCHVITIAAGDKFGKRPEVDETTSARAEVIVFNSLEQAHLDRQVDSLQALTNLAGRGAPIEVSELLVGNQPGRSSSTQITVHFNNTGQGIQFAACAQHVYEKARARGLGREIPSEWFFTDLSDWVAKGLNPTA